MRETIERDGMLKDGCTYYHHVFVTEQGVTHTLEVCNGVALLTAAQPMIDGVAMPDAVIFEWSENDLRAFTQMVGELLTLMGRRA
jgi:hypothetical protein